MMRIIELAYVQMRQRIKAGKELPDPFAACLFKYAYSNYVAQGRLSSERILTSRDPCDQARSSREVEATFVREP